MRDDRQRLLDICEAIERTEKCHYPSVPGTNSHKSSRGSILADTRIAPKKSALKKVGFTSWAAANVLHTFTFVQSATGLASSMNQAKSRALS